MKYRISLTSYYNLISARTRSKKSNPYTSCRFTYDIGSHLCWPSFSCVGFRQHTFNTTLGLIFSVTSWRLLVEPHLKTSPLAGQAKDVEHAADAEKSEEADDHGGVREAGVGDQVDVVRHDRQQVHPGQGRAEESQSGRRTDYTCHLSFHTL